jgi:GT2 family glycosyltransferase
LPELLLKLARQTIEASEIVIVDNFSSKRRLEEMRALLSSAKKKLFGENIFVKLVPITNDDFSHPYSTNLGVSVANTDLVCIMNGHSLPCSDNWLEKGVAHFKSPEVAGVGGYFTAHEDGTVWEKLSYDWGWKRCNEVTKAYAKDNHFSTVNCILKKSLWEKYPFDEKLPDEIPQARKFGGEDYDWAQEMQARGYRIIVDPKFSVSHSHKETGMQLLSKYLIWRRIRKKIRSLKRPRKAYTRLEGAKPLYYNL